MLAYLLGKSTSYPLFKKAMFLCTCHLKNVHSIDYTFYDIYTQNKITNNCLWAVSHTKTRDKIATLCSTPCSKKGHSGKHRNLMKTSRGAGQIASCQHISVDNIALRPQLCMAGDSTNSNSQSIQITQVV